MVFRNLACSNYCKLKNKKMVQGVISYFQYWFLFWLFRFGLQGWFRETTATVKSKIEVNEVQIGQRGLKKDKFNQYKIGNMSLSFRKDLLKAYNNKPPLHHNNNDYRLGAESLSHGSPSILTKPCSKMKCKFNCSLPNC